MIVQLQTAFPFIFFIFSANFYFSLDKFAWDKFLFLGILLFSYDHACLMITNYDKINF